MKIKRKITNTAVPLSLAAGEILFNEFEDYLLYRGISSVPVIAGDSVLMSLESSQLIRGDVTFTPLLSNSNVTVDLSSTYNPNAVVNTKYVKDALATIDGGNLDSDIRVGPGNYWYTENQLLTSWQHLENWYFDANRTIHAATLPLSSANVVLLGNIAPHVDVSSWIEPNSINANDTGIVFFNPTEYAYEVSCTITSLNYPVVFIGNISYVGT